MKTIRIKVIQVEGGKKRYQPQVRVLGFLWWAPVRQGEYSRGGNFYSWPVWCDSEEEAIQRADWLVNERWRTPQPKVIGYRYATIGETHGDNPGP
jgi:hypothetical protein